MHDEIDQTVATLHLRPSTTRAAEGLPRRRFSVAGVEAMVAAGIMDEDERVELIGGGAGADVAQREPPRGRKGRAA